MTPPVKLQLFNHWDPANPNDGRFRIECLTAAGPLTLSRRVKLTSHEQYLLLSVSRFSGASAPTHLEVRIDGDPVTDFDVPERVPNVVLDPLLLRLAAYRGREVLIEVIQTPTTDKSWVDWRGLGFAEYPTSTPWIPLEIKRAKSTGETIFSPLPDDSLLAAGKPADVDSYTVVAETELLGISAIRLEVLADARLAKQRAGTRGRRVVPADGLSRVGGAPWEARVIGARYAVESRPPTSRTPIRRSPARSIQIR